MEPVPLKYGKLATKIREYTDIFYSATSVPIFVKYIYFEFMTYTHTI